MRSFLLLFFFILGACAHNRQQIPNGVVPLSPDEYGSLIRKNTTKTNQYAGLYQIFQADMTIENSEVQTATLKQRGYFLQWQQSQYLQEREKMLQENSAYAKFFMRFYSPERDYDDLHKGKTIWRVYLEFNGQRIEGKVKKLTEKFVEIQTIYPHFDRFSTPYEITFNVPMSAVERGPSKVTLTSSIGNAQFEFEAGK